MSLKKSVLSIALLVMLVFAYIVQEGDTLWDLSEEYLKDPFAWEDLWKVNPHIQDPHWIYPGDSLCITGEASCPAADGVADKPVGKKSNVLTGNAKRYEYKNEGSQYRKEEPPKMFNEYYQRLIPIFEPVGKKKDKREYDWYRVLNDEASPPVHYSLEHEVLLDYGRNDFSKLKVGDISELWSNQRVSVPNTDGSIDEYFARRLVALAKITSIGDNMSRAKIVQSFGTLTLDQARCRPQSKMKAIDVKSFKQVKKAKVEDMAQVLLVLDKSIVTSLYSFVLIDYGKEENYLPGTAVAFWDIDKRDYSLPPRLLGRGLVVHSDNARSTVLIRDIYNPKREIDAGTLVSVTHQPVK